MATSAPVAADLPPTIPIPPPGASKPGDGVQIATVEIKTQAKAVTSPENITNPTLAIPHTLPQGTTQSTGKNVVSTAPKNPNIPPGFKLVQKPLGNGTFSLVLRKMTPEELTAAGQTIDTSAAPKPVTISSPSVTPVTSIRSVTASVPAIPDKPDPPVAKSESTSPPSSRSANFSAGATAIMGGLVTATESFAKMAEHGIKAHSILTGQPLPSTPSATAATPAPAAASKPAEIAPVTSLPIQSRMVVPGNADATTLGIAPTAAAGLASLPTILQAPLTQVAVPNMVGQTASVLSYYTNPAAANTIQPTAQSSAAHAGGPSSNDVHPDAHGSDHAHGPEGNADQQQDDTISHDHQNDDTSQPAGGHDENEDHHHEPQDEDIHHDHQDGDNTHDYQDGDIPYEPQDGDIPYDPQEGDIPYEPEEGDIPYEPEEGDIPYDPQDGDIPFESEDADIPYEPQDGDIPYDSQEGDIPYEDDADTHLEHEDMGEEMMSGGNDDDEGYDMDVEPQDDDDFDHDQVDDDPY